MMGCETHIQFIKTASRPALCLDCGRPAPELDGRRRRICNRCHKHQAWRYGAVADVMRSERKRREGAA